MKHQKLIDRITDIAEEDGWSVHIDEHEDRENVIEFTFGKYTDCGQDFSFSVDMRDGDIDTLIESIDAYHECYDPDEEAMLWLGPDGHGKNGAPYRMTDVVKDMEQCETFIGELLELLIEANRNECLYALEDEDEEEDHD